jgi:hypothetical protein
MYDHFGNLYMKWSTMKHKKKRRKNFASLRLLNWFQFRTT